MVPPIGGYKGIICQLANPLAEMSGWPVLPVGRIAYRRWGRASGINERCRPWRSPSLQPSGVRAGPRAPTALLCEPSILPKNFGPLCKIADSQAICCACRLAA